MGSSLDDSSSPAEYSFSATTLVTSGKLRRGQNLAALENLSLQQLQPVTSQSLWSQLACFNVRVLKKSATKLEHKALPEFTVK